MKKFSYFEKFSFKQIIGFCLLLTGMSILKFVKSLFAKQEVIEAGHHWFPFIIGLILILTAIISIKSIIEKFGIILFGLTGILYAFINPPNYTTYLLLSVLLQFIGTYCFWVANKVYKRGGSI